ncbi:uncharacterized protein [Physcomitrium patens]|uniref:Very-long-chain 3-oxoacyl-CoA synthase n=2 Tax=Physcomitrium patens TaxID=3218 RepID=A0A2K1IWS3_PHYPA|nr:elongation of very long chain fatty acids protein 5-like isoform X1 [Physcomitrium patens]PNR33724.1 hypothetical protein PHYPA_023540 [Physcomitrium patens]|eukprot:XP_024403411.1 elongation of very long chain fatty acids protein 5-like isoform X1 [Physcomitrella patens]
MGSGAAMTAFSEAGDWLVDKAARDMGLQTTCVGGNAHNLTLDSATSSFGSNLKSPSLWSITMLDSTVHKILEHYVGLDLSKPSAITVDLPLVRSPTPVVLAIIGYIVVVLLWSSHIKRAGLKPRLQDPVWLQTLVIVHNCFLCFLSFYMGWGIITEARHHRYSFWGNAGNDGHVKMGSYIYIFYVSKLYEFMDTIVMLLRRNLRQITFLHLYHHASISFIWWIISYLFPTGDAYFSAALNSWIHVVMYLYYLLAATIAKDEKRRRKYLFWGKYLTMFQMLQFVSFIGQGIHGLFYPSTYPKNMPRMLFLYSLSLLLFFSNFFISKYIRPSPKLQSKPLKSE